MPRLNCHETPWFYAPLPPWLSFNKTCLTECTFSYRDPWMTTATAPCAVTPTFLCRLLFTLLWGVLIQILMWILPNLTHVFLLLLPLKPEIYYPQGLPIPMYACFDKCLFAPRDVSARFVITSSLWMTFGLKFVEVWLPSESGVEGILKKLGLTVWCLSWFSAFMNILTCVG